MGNETRYFAFSVFEKKMSVGRWETNHFRVMASVTLEVSLLKLGALVLDKSAYFRTTRRRYSLSCFGGFALHYHKIPLENNTKGMVMQKLKLASELKSS